jgi:hypothetical protein
LTWLGLSDSFWGALAGAVVTGIIAIIVMWGQFSFYKRRDWRREADNYLKAFVLIEMHVKSVLETLEELKVVIETNNEVSKIDIVNINVSAVKESFTFLENINDDYIPREVYKEFIDTKAYLKMVYHEASAYKRTFDHTKDGVTENLILKDILIKQIPKYIEKVKGNFEKMNIYAKEIN